MKMSNLIAAAAAAAVATIFVDGGLFWVFLLACLLACYRKSQCLLFRSE